MTDKDIVGTLESFRSLPQLLKSTQDTLAQTNATLMSVATILSKIAPGQVTSMTVSPNQATPTSQAPQTPPAPGTFEYVAKRVQTPTVVQPNQKFTIFEEENGILYNIWIRLDSDSFELNLTINGEVFSTDLPELAQYVGTNLLVNNDWTLTYMNSSPTGPPFAMRFQSVNGLQFDKINFNLLNTDPANPHTIQRFRYFYVLAQ